MLIILSVIIVILSLSALLCGFLKGDMTAVSVASLEGCNKAVELVIYLSGSMCLWGGLMKICEKAGITAVIARMLSPVTIQRCRTLPRGHECRDNEPDRKPFRIRQCRHTLRHSHSESHAEASACGTKEVHFYACGA